MLDSSKLFDEFIMRRCEEILQDNKEYQETDSKIRNAEKILLNIASNEVKELYLEIDFLCQRQKILFMDSLKKH